jgi:membrane protein DedA with SNARE-associated domain
MTALVAGLGPLGVFLLMVPESACIPVPSELTLMCAGFGVGQGWMPLWAAVLAATAGNMAGSLIAYGIGRASARRDQPARLREALGGIERLFARHGNRAVFWARLMPLARSFVSLPAGYARVPLAPFATMTAAGCAIWALAFVLLGLLAGDGWAELSGTIGDLLLAATAVGVLLALYLRKRRGSGPAR